MASGRRAALGVDVPTLEPDDVMLHRLSTLSACSTPTPRALRAGAKLLVAVTASATIGATSWVAGALPGTPSPFEPAENPGQLATAGQPRTGDGIGSPQPDDDSTPGGPLSPGPPGDHPGHASLDIPPVEDGTHATTPGAPRREGRRPADAGRGPGNGRDKGVGRGDDRNAGHPGRGQGKPDNPGKGNGEPDDAGKRKGQGNHQSAYPSRGNGQANGHDKHKSGKPETAAKPGKGKGHHGTKSHKSKQGKGGKKGPPVRGRKGR